MAAPKGNKYGFGNQNAGRPATWTKEIIEDEAKHLIEWAQRDDAVVLREFAPLRGYPHTYMYDWSDPEHSRYSEAFHYAFEFARSLIGSRREKIIMEKASARDLAMYHKQLDNFETEKMKLKIELTKAKAEAESQASTSDLCAMAQAIADLKAENEKLKKKIGN